jgi:hypothetical protein
MGLTTKKSRLRTEVEIGTWGSLCTLLLFFSSAIVEYFTRGNGAWVSAIGCIVGTATIVAVLLRAHLFALTLRTRTAFRALRRGQSKPSVEGD